MRTASAIAANAHVHYGQHGMRKAICFGSSRAVLAFLTTYAALNVDRWRWERLGLIVCGTGDDGWFAASVAALVAYILVFTPFII